MSECFFTAGNQGEGRKESLRGFLTFLRRYAPEKKEEEGMIYIVLWLACAIGSGVIASSKKRSFGSWLILGGLLGPIALLIVGFMAKADVVSSGERVCPFCAETIKFQAKVCKHCGREVEPELPVILPMQTSFKPLAATALCIVFIGVSGGIYGALKKSIEDNRKIADQKIHLFENDKYDIELFEYGGNTVINYILSVNKIYSCLHGIYVYRYITKDKVHILCNAEDNILYEYTVYTKKDRIESGFK